MRRGWLVGLLMAGFVGSGLLVAGCGGPEEGTHVQVDKEKEDAILKAMEAHYKKQAQGKRGVKASPRS